MIGRGKPGILREPGNSRRTATTSRGSEHHRLVVGEGEGERLDRFLARRLGFSRSRCVGLIGMGLVQVENRETKKSEAVSAGQVVLVEVPPPEALEAEAQDIPLDIVFEDEHFVVVNKPAGLVVHPAPGHPNGTLVNALLHHVHDLSGIGGKLRPGIVHRLDRDTSGLLVVAKGDRAHVALSNAIRKREVRRIYRAVAWGHLPESPLTVDAPVGRDPKDRKRMAVVEGGRRALTRIKVRERWTAAEYLDISLKTGRTHQIRVHLSHLGHPVVGDRVYGPKWGRGMGGSSRVWPQELERRAPRQLLHSSDLSFLHPISGEEMRFHAPLPPDMDSVVRWARGEGGERARGLSG
ncbi:MAG: RluA family pseudouridine synthase [Longimicrobiales bacterium]|nr:RluA family pseudouridine synthase [Longimicrobiales bacterium]